MIATVHQPAPVALYEAADAAGITRYDVPGGTTLFVQSAPSLSSERLLAMTLSRYEGRPIRTSSIVRSAYGEPMLECRAGDARPGFSVSGAAGWRGVAVAPAGRIGLDMETIARVAANATRHDRWLSASEAEALAPWPDDRILDELACRWVLKEAYAKVRGIGLNLPLHTIGFAADGPAIVASASQAGDAAYLARCRFRLMRVGPLLIGIVHHP
ncbi:4'-phosphopantetheinyl transferase superfamily protein [Sphingomonas sp. CROZ-RG-20F-R02-07]|uniref:4'-phosphopantetheinyl transferase family protein n=1 Tax=Sphingomonas sp. CROZ-RG-20F-R02-07 TaxID=2914832 RepID=UPI001F571160|nr:4'-phosphopantetheinyl transferase superfamily protein [Sphingomonas sp. CROZ-RG-20F-R02-07]